MLTVGVVVPYYNHSKFVKEAVSSLLAQTRLPDYIQVVDDGSSAEESALLWDYLRDIPIGGVKHKENWGPAAARNSGIKRLLELGADIVICLDDDDTLAPGYVEMMVDALDEHPEALVAYPDVQMVGFEQRVVKAPPEYDPGILMMRPFIVAGAAFRAEMWQEVFRYNGEGWDTRCDKWGWEDYLFWMEGLLGVAGGNPRAAVHAGPSKFWYLYRRFNRPDRSDGNEPLLRSYMAGKMQELYGVTLPPMGRERI